MIFVKFIILFLNYKIIFLFSVEVRILSLVFVRLVFISDILILIIISF